MIWRFSQDLEGVEDGLARLGSGFMRDGRLL